MEIKVLEERIAKKESQIVKLEKKVEKWTNNKTSEKAFQKEYEWLEGCDNYEERLASARIDWAEDCDREIRCANRDLNEARETLVKYQNQLEAIKQFEEEEKIEVIWNFLTQWKENVKEFIREDTKNVLEYYKFNSMVSKKWNSGFYRNNKEQYEIDRKEEKRLKHIPHSLTMKVFTRSSSTLVDEEELEKTLRQEVNNRYKDLIDRVSSITGKINDASLLYMGNKGDINGYIKGEKGKAKVETIGAGGYNIQCYHYRTLINEAR